MKYLPHSYQAYAMNFILENPVSALLLDMGLGKTIITLTAINDLMLDYFNVSKTLVIAPLRVAVNTWPNEIKKWDHLKHLKLSVVIGSEKERLKALEKPSHIYVINRENVDWLINKSGADFNYDMVVIDELSSFKSYTAKRFKALMKVRPNIKRIVGLTGTPSSNGLMDLFAQFKVLDGGKRLGRFISQYRDSYFDPDKRNGMVIFSYKLKDGAEEKIYEKISDITISMKSTDYLDMPKLIVNKYEVCMEDKERNLYNRLKKELLLGDEVSIINAAALGNKLSQMANGAIYTDDKSVMPIHDKKLGALEDIIESQNGKPMLLTYWFRHDLNRIKTHLEKLKINFRTLDTNEDIHEWNKGNIKVAILHPASAGHGLNLQEGGNHMVWFSPIWSLELYQQTNARLYRQGQKQSTVVITHIIAKDTIDEEILKALKKKDTSQKALIEAVKANIDMEVVYGLYETC